MPGGSRPIRVVLTGFLLWTFRRLAFRGDIDLIRCFDGLPEVTNASSKPFADIRQLASAENDEHDDQDNEQLAHAETKHNPATIRYMLDPRQGMRRDFFLQPDRTLGTMPPMSTTALTPPRIGRRDPLAVFLFLSLLLHVFLFLVLPLPQRDALVPTEPLTEVELLPSFPVPKSPPRIAKAEPPKDTPKPAEKPQPAPQEKLPEQIVNPPDQSNDQPPDKTRLFSDRDSSAKEQTVAAGVPQPAPGQDKGSTKNKLESQKPPIQTALKKQTVKPTTKPPPEKAEKQLEQALSKEAPPRSREPGNPDAPPRVPQLFARPDDLLAQGWLSEDGSDQEKKERQPPQGRDLIALAPPPRESLLSLPGPPGTPDFLPDVRQGNLTFLNTKAHRFAPFVRRVALRVFQHLIIYQRKSLDINDVVAARDMVTIQAKLDANGTLKGLIIQTRSGSYSVDESLLRACEQGAWDENPPEEAKAEDGLIHFIFRSDINAQYDDLGALRAIITLLQVGLV